MVKDIFSLKIGGQAGQGVKSAGQMLAKLATRSGYFVFTYTEFPSLIRGGHNVTQVIIGENEIDFFSKKVDFLVALNQETIDRHLNEVSDNGLVIFDSDKKISFEGEGKSLNFSPLPLSRFAVEAGNRELLGNMVAIGGVAAFLDGDLEVLKNLIEGEFKDKSEEVIVANKKAAVLGYEFVKKEYGRLVKKVLTYKKIPEKKMLISGSDALALGAIAGGLQFAAIYPMSPISNILHVLAKYQEKLGFVYKQPEDEISAIGMAIGAGFAGARSMTATSGGGFCLMTEGFGLAGMTETPLVIVEGMRPGPATGLPTWSAQGDLKFVLNAHQGSFPRIVLSAGDIKEAFFMTMKAFNLAEKYQTPVVLLVDKNICDGDASYPFFDISGYKIERGKIKGSSGDEEIYSRYTLNSDGISERTFPGGGVFFIANSDEHDQEGFSSEESEVVVKMQEKRMKKLEVCQKEDMEDPKLYGSEEADLTIVSWGSNKGSIIEAIEGFSNVNFLYLNWMNPFPASRVREILAKSKYIVDVECNYEGQLADLIAEKTGILISDRFLKYDGRPFFVEEIIEKINQVLKR